MLILAHGWWVTGINRHYSIVMLNSDLKYKFTILNIIATSIIDLIIQQIIINKIILNVVGGIAVLVAFKSIFYG